MAHIHQVKRPALSVWASPPQWYIEEHRQLSINHQGLYQCPYGATAYGLANEALPQRYIEEHCHLSIKPYQYHYNGAGCDLANDATDVD